MDDLIAILLAEAGVFRRLLPLIEEEQRVLVGADTAGLQEVSSRREALVTRLARLERDRQAALGHLADALGVEPAGLTLSRLMELLPAEARALRPVRAELRKLLPDLLVRNGKNRVVAEHTLACLRGLFTSFLAALTAGPTYTQSGRSEHSVEELRLLDRHA